MRLCAGLWAEQTMPLQRMKHRNRRSIHGSTPDTQCRPKPIGRPVFLAASLALVLNVGCLGQAPSSTGAPQVNAPAAQSTRQQRDLIDYLKAFANHYTPGPTPNITKDDLPRLHGLLDQDGNIQLSVPEALALTLENNLDIASARLLHPIAQTDLMRAKAGELLRNIPTSISSSPSTAAGPISAAGPSGFFGLNQSGVLSGLSVQLAGSQIPQLDPTVYASGFYSHTNRPEVNTIVEGTDLLVSQTEQWKAGVQKSFLTGTALDLSMTGLRLSQNAPNNIINPALTADIDLRLEQPLLQGGSYQANARAIHIAQNGLKVADIAFRQQVTVTVSEMLTLYYDLLTFRDQLEISRRALAASQATLQENRKRLELGTIEASDLIESEAAVSANEQEAENSETQVEEQELTLKSVLMRKGLQDPTLLRAHLIPIDRFEPRSPRAADEAMEAIAEKAIHQRPEVERANLDLQSKRLSLLGTRDALKPTFNAYVELQTNALAGRLNLVAQPGFTGTAPSQFIGGYGTALNQLVHGTYPDYTVGFQLNVPIVNRAARADMARDQIDLQQQRIAAEKMKDAIRLQALNSAFALREARHEYEVSVAQRKLRERSLNTEQKMFDLGTSGIEDLMSAQKKLQFSEQQEVNAFNTYVHANINLDAVLNETIERNHIILDEPAHSKSQTSVDANR